MSGVFSSGGRAPIVGMAFRDSSNTLRNVSAAFFRNDDNALKSWFSSLAASVLPDMIAGYGNSPASVTVTTEAATASPAGGVPPFAYQWEDIDGIGWTITSPTAATTTFSHAVAAGDLEAAYFRCKINDAAGSEAYTPNVSVSAANLGGA